MKSIFFLISILTLGFASILGMEEKWVNLELVSGALDTSGPVWRIEDEFIALNLKAKDHKSGESFEQLLEKAREKHIPYILLRLYDSTDDSFEFVDGSYLLGLYQTMKSPTGKSFDQVVIFAAGDGEFFDKIMVSDEKDFKEEIVKEYHFITSKKEVNSNLQRPGYGQLLIADILKNEVTLTEAGRKEYYDIQDKIRSLEEAKATAADDQVIKIENEITELEKQQQNLLYTKGIPTEVTHRWFEWALKYLPKNTPEYEQAKKELDEINVKLGKVVPEEPKKPEKPEEPAKPVDPQVDQKILLQHLQNLTRSFEQLAAQLT